jgi:hypothetical protein
VITSISQARALGEKYGIPTEDVLFTALNTSGINSGARYKRLRFLLKPRSLNDGFYFGLPIRSGDSPFSYRPLGALQQGFLTLGGEIIGHVQEAFEDTCDSTYPRRNGTVMNLNSGVKSACGGCAFCTTSAQTPRDIGDYLQEAGLRRLFEDFRIAYNKPDLSHLMQVAVVTGCLGSEDRVLEHLLTVRRVLKTYNYEGELLYFGSEIVSRRAFDVIKHGASPFAFCLSVECFTRRSELLRNTKARNSLERHGFLETAKWTLMCTFYSLVRRLRFTCTTISPEGPAASNGR